jgi:hypothetical protein
MDGAVVVWHDCQPKNPYEGREHNYWIDCIKWYNSKNWFERWGKGLACNRFVTVGGDDVS